MLKKIEAHKIIQNTSLLKLKITKKKEIFLIFSIKQSNRVIIFLISKELLIFYS